MRTFVYFHFTSQGELEAVYLWDDEYYYIEFPILNISVSTLSDACTITEEFNRSALGDLEYFNDILSNDVKAAQKLLTDLGAQTYNTKVRHTPLFQDRNAVYDLAAGILARETRHWLELSRERENDGIDPEVSETRHLLSRIQGILNRERFA